MPESSSASESAWYATAMFWSATTRLSNQKHEWYSGVCQTESYAVNYTSSAWFNWNANYIPYCPYAGYFCDGMCVLFWYAKKKNENTKNLSNTTTHNSLSRHNTKGKPQTKDLGDKLGQTAGIFFRFISFGILLTLSHCRIFVRILSLNKRIEVTVLIARNYYSI